MTRRGWLLFAAVCLLWGMPYAFIKVALHALTPVQIACVRVAIGSLLLVPLAAHRRAFTGLARRWRSLLAYSVVELAVAWPLVGIAEQHISSSLTAVLLAEVPLVTTILLAVLDPAQRPTRAVCLGLAIGLAGVLTIVGTGGGELGGALAVMCVAVCYAVGPLILTRRLAGTEPLGVIAASFTITTVLLLPLALAERRRAPSLGVVGSLAVLGTVCTAVAFVAFFALIAEVGPARASIITYMLPLVATAIGVTTLGDHLRASMAPGLALILAGSWLATGGAAHRRAARPVPAAAPAADPPTAAPAADPPTYDTVQP